MGTATGVMLRLAQADIPASSRSAKGVRVVRLGEGDTVATVTAMSGEGEGETDDEGGGGGGGNGVAGASAARGRRASSAAAASSSSASKSASAPGTGRKTSYMIFCDSKREEVRAELLGGSGGDASAAKMTNVAKELGRRWRGLSEAEKAKYKQ